jgi:carbamoyl-phosphate synthase large subunit
MLALLPQVVIKGASMTLQRVLVFPCGTGVALEIYDALCNRKEIELYGASADDNNHGCLLPYKHVTTGLPLLAAEPDRLLEALFSLVTKHQITAIIPAYDDAINYLAAPARRLRLEAAGAKVITSAWDVCDIARSKSRTYACLQDVVRTPRVLSLDRPLSDPLSYPVFVKPDAGSSARGANVVRNDEELRVFRRACQDPIVLEYLPGEEYTIDCFSDRDGGVLFVGPRRRCRVRDGMAMRTEAILKDGETLEGLETLEGQFTSMAKRIWSKLAFWGAWFFQVKRAADGSLALLEVAPRIAGAMGLYRNLGINMPLLSLLEADRQPISLLFNAKHYSSFILDKGFINRFKADMLSPFDMVYVDLEDTLVVHGKVNLQLIQLLYQCVNDGVSLKLVTRCAQPELVLVAHKLQALFEPLSDNVVTVPRGRKKSEFIPCRGAKSSSIAAIFIDDSFSERLDVAQQCEWPTFDTNMLECLLRS